LEPFLQNFNSFLIGISCAASSYVRGARRFEELLSWQRGHELHVEIWKACERPPASRDFEFKAQIRDASESVPRNIAEGFGRFSPAQFVAFLDVSRASALETKSLLMKGLAVGYWNEKEFKRLDALATRAIQAIAKFQRYLRSSRAKRNADRCRPKGANEDEERA
jgi:four helix bundle protein